MSALVLGVLGVALAGLGYAYQGESFNSAELVGPAVFWLAAIYFVLSVPLRDACRTFSKEVRTPLGMSAFVLYMAIHLILYGFVFEAILASIFGVGPFSVTSGIYVNTNLFSPLSIASVVFDLAYNPVLTLTAPPVFSTALSFYSVAVAFVIAVLVVANVGKTKELGATRTAMKKAKTFVALPAVGVVLGASCCLSLAGLLSLASPGAAFLATSPWVYYATYFLFPCVALAVLHLNLRAMTKAAIPC